MRTFEELAQAALSQEPTHMVAKELAEAMHRLEYNLAKQLVSLDTQVPPVSKAMRDIRTNQWLEALRADLP
jgi:hypothetical protein